MALEEINRKSREILLKTKDIVQKLGYELIYADTDAAFVHKDNATEDDYEILGEIISKETGFALSLEYHYKFLVLLPLEADEKLEALKHYFGITCDGELVTRGIETRRHDTSKFIKDFQIELLYTLFDANSTTEIIERTLELARQTNEQCCFNHIVGLSSKDKHEFKFVNQNKKVEELSNVSDQVTNKIF
jgi:DNA polymerase elongation subunit (family B)